MGTLLTQFLSSNESLEQTEHGAVQGTAPKLPQLSSFAVLYPSNKGARLLGGEHCTQRYWQYPEQEQQPRPWHQADKGQSRQPSKLKLLEKTAATASYGRFASLSSFDLFATRNKGVCFSFYCTDGNADQASQLRKPTAPGRPKEQLLRPCAQPPLFSMTVDKWLHLTESQFPLLRNKKGPLLCPQRRLHPPELCTTLQPHGTGSVRPPQHGAALAIKKFKLSLRVRALTLVFPPGTKPLPKAAAQGLGTSRFHQHTSTRLGPSLAGMLK